MRENTDKKMDKARQTNREKPVRAGTVDVHDAKAEDGAKSVNGAATAADGAKSVNGAANADSEKGADGAKDAVTDLTVRAFAKINLSLDVLGRLRNGYHQVKMVMHAIDLHDVVQMAWLEDDACGGLVIALDPGSKDLPADGSNLAWQAAERMHRAYCPERRGRLLLRIEKNIPSGAGLAGGSSDAAAVMLGLAMLWSLPKDLSTLCRLGATVGADVVFCLMSIAACEPQLGFCEDPQAATCALAEGTGVEMTPLPSVKAELVLSKPDFSVSTAEVYRGIDACRIDAHPDVDAQVEGIRRGSMKMVLENMGNVLENYSLNRYDEIVYTKNTMKKLCDPCAVLMSGSGPTVFAITEAQEQKKRLFEAMRRINRETFVSCTIQKHTAAEPKQNRDETEQSNMK